MAREANLWYWMKENSKLVPGLHLVRIENALSRGTPDVEGHYSRSFWIELKGADRPKRASTPVRFDLKPEQRLWLERRWSVGGLAWLYIRVGRDRNVSRYVLAPQPAGTLAEVAAGVPEKRLEELALLPPGHAFPELLARVSHRLDMP